MVLVKYVGRDLESVAIVDVYGKTLPPRRHHLTEPEDRRCMLYYILSLLRSTAEH